MQEEAYKILPNGNKVTCAVIVQDPTGAILAVHPTGHRFNQDWSLPKGLANEGEFDVIAALRELEEETGLSGDFNVQDLGVHPYIKGKDIHLYKLLTGTEFTEELLLNRFCKSLFISPTDPDVAVAEIDAYRIVRPGQWNLFNKGLQAVLNKIQDKLIN